MRKLGFVTFAAVLIAASGAMAALGWYLDEDIARTKAMQTTGSSFAQLLHRQYIALADEELKRSDHLHSRRYERKARQAGGGVEVQPESLSGWLLPRRADKPLKDGRARLLKALDGSARKTNPAAGARAQAMFDCWVEEEHEDWWLRAPGVAMYQPKDIARCKDAFMAAMRELEGAPKPKPKAMPRPAPAPSGPDFIVFFAFDKSNLDADANKEMSGAIAMAKGKPNARISVFGHTDRAGSAEYNLGLSKQRASSVVNAFTAAGIKPTRIVSSSFGESQNRVFTADGIRHPMNRRAEITIR